MSTDSTNAAPRSASSSSKSWIMPFVVVPIAVAVIGAAGVIVATLVGRAGSEPLPTSAPSVPGSIGPSTSTNPAGPVTPPPPKPLAKGEVEVVCSAPTSAHQGAVLQVIYHYSTVRAGTIGDGAGLYTAGGEDISTGGGDTDELVLPAGESERQRTVQLPANMAPGRYELVAELWPPNEIGSDGIETVAEHTCGSINIT